VPEHPEIVLDTTTHGPEELTAELVRRLLG
jgi:hypothetical protein